MADLKQVNIDNSSGIPLDQVDKRTIVSILISSKNSLRVLLTNDSLRIRIQFFGVYLLFGIVSLGMTVVNVMTDYRMLMISTLVFGILNLINVVFCLISHTTEMIARVLFVTESILLFTFFLVCGEPEGFSAMWILLIPTCGMFLFRIQFGSMISLLQFAIIIYLLWIPSGQQLLQYNYTSAFMARFPLLYIAFFFCGLFFEFIRNNTQEELTNTREQYRYLSVHDPLTGLFNRAGFNAVFLAEANRLSGEGYGIAIMDIDKFKNINDSYGHFVGDQVLRGVAEIIEQNVGQAGLVGRWGGEEFSAMFYDLSQAEAVCEQIRADIEKHRFKANGISFHVTISIGLLLVSPGSGYTTSEQFSMADNNLYSAKQNGRNQVFTTSISTDI